MPSGIRINTDIEGADIGGLRARFNVWQTKMAAETRAAVKRAVSLGENHMKTVIATSGTAASGKAGRIETGHMIDSVESRTKGNQYWGSGEFGWLTAQEMYFTYQEKGFMHVRAGRWIPGMFAFHDAWPQAEAYIRAELRRIVG